jgi:hypothetical protein
MTILNTLYNFKNLFLQSSKLKYTIIIKETHINASISDSIFERPIETLGFATIEEVAIYLKSKNIIRANKVVYDGSVYYKTPVGLSEKLSAHLDKGWGTFTKKQLWRLLNT